MRTYYDTRVSDCVRLNSTNQLYRISIRNQVPYITYERKTRVLYQNQIGGAYINIRGRRIYFV